MILERSFAMFCQEGMGAVNARSVAKALNCSTQPIFSYFSGMDDLKNALDQKARDEFEQMAAQNADKEHVLESCCHGVCSQLPSRAAASLCAYVHGY